MKMSEREKQKFMQLRKMCRNNPSPPQKTQTTTTSNATSIVVAEEVKRPVSRS